MMQTVSPLQQQLMKIRNLIASVLFPIKFNADQRVSPAALAVSLLVSLLRAAQAAPAPATPPIQGVEWQPLAAQVERVLEAMDYVGSPVSEEIKAWFEKLRFEDDKQRAVQEA